jgi:predicted lipid-binding transport protein (Tim44 family)
MKTFQTRLRRMGMIFTAASVLALPLISTSVEAKRLGGGQSIGKQVSPSHQSAPNHMASPGQQQQAARPTPATPTPQAPMQQPPKRNWGAMLGGLAAGAGLAMLLSHFGLGGAAASFIGNLLLIAAIAFIGMWLFRRFRSGSNTSSAQPAFAGMASPPPVQPAPTSDLFSGINRQTYDTPSSTSLGQPVQPEQTFTQGGYIPPQFDTETFVRQAKIYFVRLQEAWDRADLNDIREFTTPAMFAEVRQQIQERGNGINRTDVVTLNAEVTNVEEGAIEHIVSVRFSGMLREVDAQRGEAPAESFVELWNLTKPATGNGGWVLAGIQQNS